MSREIFYHSAIQGEIREILDYYEAISGQLADDFWVELTEAKSTPTKRGATAGIVENRAEDPAQPPLERSRRTGRALQRRPPHASAPTDPTGRPIQTPIRRTSARSGSVQQHCIRAEGGSRTTLKTSLAPAS
jgi:hypothetical protein